MIIINKGDDTTTVVLPQISVADKLFKLALYSDYTKKEYTLYLGDNYSESIERYSKFLIYKDDLQGYESGEYNYAFIEDNVELSRGIFFLKDNTDKIDYQSIVPPVESNDYYVVQTN